MRSISRTLYRQRLLFLKLASPYLRGNTNISPPNIRVRGWKLLCKPPQDKMGILMLREFYANAKMTGNEKQTHPHLTTFVRGREVDFCPESIRVVLQLPEIADSPQSYEARKDGDQRLEDVIRNIYVCKTLVGNWTKIDYILTAVESKDDTSRPPFPSIIWRLCHATGVPPILDDEHVPIDRPITVESMERVRYPQELNQQFQGMRVEHSQFLQNFQTQQTQFFLDFRNQQAQYHQEFHDMKVQQSQVYQDIQTQQSLTHKAVQEMKKVHDRQHKEFLDHKREYVNVVGE
ncbi:hypothetical protein PIB30_057395 [Stylosanthes scabra]|uniref:Uncharacterized protein n=1 Tax=Stylosanthes scabra TaxID=79078 RepID=A0ABU6VJG4_9FABA|nr:hypothetical protein [Stylosanthes scabra]